MILDLFRRDASQDRLFAALGDAFPLPGILVNNAGTIRRANFTEFPLTDWDEVIETNLTAPFRLSQRLAALWIAQGRGGKIIHTASKSALAGLTRLMANELAAKGINVNATAPGYMATDNTTALRADPTRNQAILERTPAARWGESADLAGALVFLASRASDYVHGHILAVDGGWLAR